LIKTKLNILITGINGFIGKAFLDILQKNKFNIYGLDIEMNNNYDYSKLVNFYEIDISKKFRIEQKFDFVFHLAALNQTHIGKKDYSDYYKTNVLGTENIINGISFTRFVIMSTAKIYKPNGIIIDESSLVFPIADYEKSKFEAEELCKNYINNNNLTILRPVNIVGPGQGQKAVLPIFFQKAMKNQSIEVFAPKKSVLQLLYISDVIRMFQLLIELKSTGIFNLSSKDNISIEFLAREIVRITNSKSKIIFSNNEKVNFSEISSLKAKEIVNWEPKINTKEILNLYYKSLQNEEKK